jgi:hypothetical protein
VGAREGVLWGVWAVLARQQGAAALLKEVMNQGASAKVGS